MRFCFAIALFLAISSLNSYASSCGECHDAPPQDRSHRTHSRLKAMTPSYGDHGFTQLYTEQARAYGFNCGNCHPEEPTKHQNGSLEVETSNKTSSGLKALNSSAALYDKKNKTCTGIYCHSTGEGQDKLVYIKSPRWNGQEKASRCQACHTSPPTYPSTRQRPNGHFNSARGSGHLLGIHWDSVQGHTKESFQYNTSTYIGCSTCHFDTVNRDTDRTFVDPATGLFTCVKCHELKDGDIDNYSTHVNGKVEISFAPIKVRAKAQMYKPPKGWKRKGAKGKITAYDRATVPLNAITYSRKERSCSNVSCHLYAEKVFWYDKIDCKDCHTDFQ